MDIISRLAKANFALFPLRGKIPANGDSWPYTAVDHSLTSFDLAGNYGVVVGSRLIIDVDVKKDQPGKESFKKLGKDLGLPAGWETDTFVVRTGSGGFHIYLECPPNVRTKKHLKDYPGLEFLHGNFYVVGPGSIHPDTHRPYEISSGDPGILLPTPPVLLDLLTRTVETTGVQPHPDFIDDDPINVQRFVGSLKEMPEVKEGGRTNSLYLVAARGREYGLSVEKCFETLQAHYNGVKLVPAVDEGEAHRVVNNAFLYAKGKAGGLNVKAIFETIEVGEKEAPEEMFMDNHKGKLLRTLNNAVNYLLQIPKLDKCFRYNQFSQVIEISSHVPWFKERGELGPAIQDIDYQLLKYFLAKVVRIEFSSQTIVESVGIVAHKRHYHPVRNYLNALKWDGKERLSTWLIDYCNAADTSYTRAVGRKVLCAAVKRVFEPGCQWDYVLVLEGRQGLGKSTVCRILGRQWGGDLVIDPHNKDTLAAMKNKWIVELSEMAALKWSDANILKAFITRKTDSARMVYERNSCDIKRQSIFIGTINPEHVGYLNDIENRRYWVVHCPLPIDTVALEHDIDQLWAEARIMYEQEKLWLEGDAAMIQFHETSIRRPEDPLRLNVLKWSQDHPDTAEATVEEVLQYLGIPATRITRGEQSRVAQVLVEMGWHKNTVRTEGIWVTFYQRPIKEILEHRVIKE